MSDTLVLNEWESMTVFKLKVNYKQFDKLFEAL